MIVAIKKALQYRKYHRATPNYYAITQNKRDMLDYSILPGLKKGRIFMTSKYESNNTTEILTEQNIPKTNEVSKDFYREEIIKLINCINRQDVLEYLYGFITERLKGVELTVEPAYNANGNEVE